MREPLYQRAVTRAEQAAGIALTLYPPRPQIRHVEIVAVILSAAKNLARRTPRSFAALRMTARTLLKSAHGKLYLQMSGVNGWASFLHTYVLNKSNRKGPLNVKSDAHPGSII